MEGAIHQSVAFIFILVSLWIHHSEQLQSSQGQTLLRIQRLLNYPSVLSSWNSSADFCNLEPNSSVTVVCYEESISQLHIIGNKGAPLLPRNFSIDSFVTTLVSLPNLKVLTLASLGLWGQLPDKIARLSSLEILNISSNFLYGTIPEGLSLLSSLQTVILDDNMFAGEVPNWIRELPGLTVLSLRKNMLNGSLPSSFSSMKNLRILALSHNYMYGGIPDLHVLTNLQVLDLEDNAFGPQFPRLGNRLVTLVLSNNNFRAALPAEVSTYYQLEWLDISNNKFVGPFPTALLSLPSITYLNITNNMFTGMIFENQSCGADLDTVDLSSNLLTGSLPKCLLPDSKKKVLYDGNCLATGGKSQHPDSFCRNEALAVGILPREKKGKQAAKAILALYVVGGILGVIAIISFIFLLVKRLNSMKTIRKRPTRLISENASTGYPSKLLSDARYISQTMKLGALGLPAYRTFSLEELEEATNNFDTSTFMGEISQGQMYRGRLKDGSLVAVRCLKMKRRHSTQNFMHLIELISKLRHRHLVSALGHCFECYLDDSSVSRIFLVFEYVPNGTLRSWISERHSRRSLNWAQRIAAAIGVAKGVQFLHTGILPGVYSNNLKITDVLLDQNLITKISVYSLPLLAESMQKIGREITSSGSKVPTKSASFRQEEAADIYDFGVILLEIIVGRSLNSENEVTTIRDQMQVSILDESSRRSIIDPALKRAYSDESLKTVMEISLRCLINDPTCRPSVEDVLWNLQFAAQVQDAWRGDSQSSEGSPISTSQPPRLHLAIHYP